MSNSKSHKVQSWRMDNFTLTERSQVLMTFIVIVSCENLQKKHLTAKVMAPK